MAWLNYHHLLYFWTVARTGSVARAAEELELSQPTVSGQVHALEEALGVKLLDRVGRNVVPSEAGQVVFRYADEIFGLGKEMVEALSQRPVGPPEKLSIGVSDALPKLSTTRLLEPAVQLKASFRLDLRVDRTDRLVADLAVNALDLVLADQPLAPTLKVRAFSHPLGEWPVSVFAPAEEAPRYRRGFPRSLHGAPFVMQATGSALRRSLDEWLAREGLVPRVMAEIQDVGLLQMLAAEGLGLFAAPSLVEDELRRQYGFRVVGRIDQVRERFYAISAERKPRHPAVLAILAGARDRT